MRPPRFSLTTITILVWVCAILLSCGCGSNLRSQVALRAIADQAKRDCLTVGKKCSDMVKGAESKLPIQLLDPFCGSGTTLYVAKQLGRNAIGCDISEKACNIAIERLAQEVMVI